MAPKTLWGDVSWENYRQGKAGGTESVTLHVAQKLEEFGHDVKIVPELDGKPDIAIGVNTILPPGSAGKIYLDSHQAWSSIHTHLDGIFVRSYFHQRTQRNVNPGIDIDKFFIVGNGIDTDEWNTEYVKVKNKFIWASSPERGLLHLLNIWPSIKYNLPDAELHIYYDVERALEGWRYGVNRMNIEAQIMHNKLTKKEQLLELGIMVHGMVQRDEYVKAMQSAEKLLYTCDPQYPSELFCITAAEAIASKTQLVIPAEVDCLEELYGKYSVLIEGPPIDEYPDHTINHSWISAATITPEEDKLLQYKKEVEELYSWYNVSRRYEAVLQGEEMDFGKPKLRLIPGIING